MADDLNLTGIGPKGKNVPTGERMPHFGADNRPLSEGFVANVKEFLTERPVKVVHGSEPTVFTPEGFGTGFVANLKEYFAGGPKVARGAAPSRLAIDWQAGHRTFWQNLRDAISPPKLPPLKVTSKPVHVKEMCIRDRASGGAVQRVSHNGPAERRKMRTDLMRAPGM